MPLHPLAMPCPGTPTATRSSSARLTRGTSSRCRSTHAVCHTHRTRISGQQTTGSSATHTLELYLGQTASAASRPRTSPIAPSSKRASSPSRRGTAAPTSPRTPCIRVSSSARVRSGGAARPFSILAQRRRSTAATASPVARTAATSRSAARPRGMATVPTGAICSASATRRAGPPPMRAGCSAAAIAPCCSISTRTQGPCCSATI